MSVCTDACLRWGWHLLRESRGEGRRKPATPPMPRVEVDSPQLDHATVFWGRFFSRHHKTAEKASPQRPGILRASVISRLDPYNRLRGPVREKRPLALTRRGFFLSGLFRRGEATTPPDRSPGGSPPAPRRHHDCQTISDSLDFPRGSSPVKEDAHMVQFLQDAAAQAVAGVVVALFVYWLNRR